MAIRRLDDALLDGLMARASSTSRRRQHLNLHASYEESCQRLLNAICPDSYIRPHRHLEDPKVETLLVLRGSLKLLRFDDRGEVVDIVAMAAGIGGAASLGVELHPGTWHTVVADEPGAILLEIKGGPFCPLRAKEPALWAPDEGSARACEYLNHLKSVIAAGAVV